MKKIIQVCSFVLILALFPFSKLYAIDGVCVPTPPCFCNQECFNCGPGGCSKRAPAGGSYTPPSDDTEQKRLEEARRQQEIEEQRKKQEEEAKKRQMEFERKKEETLRDMKGIQEGELGINNKDDSFGLKGMSSTDANVVDLRDKKAPYIVDPNTVKGNSAAGSRANARNRPPVSHLQEFLFPDDPSREVMVDDIKKFVFPDHPDYPNEVKDFLFPADPRKSIFPKNPDKPLLNPLREPGKWKAFEEAAEKNIMANARKNRAEQVIKKMDEDAALNEAKWRIVREEEKAIYKIRDKNFAETTRQFQRLDKKYGVKTYSESQKKRQENAQYSQKEQQIIDNYWQKTGKDIIDIRQKSYEQFN